MPDTASVNLFMGRPAMNRGAVFGRVWMSRLLGAAAPRYRGFGVFGTWLRDLSRDRSRSRIRRFGQALVLAAELPPSD